MKGDGRHSELFLLIKKSVHTYMVFALSIVKTIFDSRSTAKLP